MNSCDCGKGNISDPDCTCNTFDPQTNRPTSTVDRFCLKRYCISRRGDHSNKTFRQIIIYDKEYLNKLGIDKKFAGQLAICLQHYKKEKKEVKHFWDNFIMKNQMSDLVKGKKDLEKGLKKKYNLIKIPDYGPNSVPELQKRIKQLVEKSDSETEAEKVSLSTSELANYLVLNKIQKEKKTGQKIILIFMENEKYEYHFKVTTTLRVFVKKFKLIFYKNFILFAYFIFSGFGKRD